MAEAEPGLRQRNKERTRGRLLSAALSLFGERGFDRVTVDEIADRAEVSTSTLFRYFPTKEDLLLDGSHHLGALMEAFSGRPVDEPVLVSLRAAMVTLAQDYQQDRRQLIDRYRIITASPALMARVLEQQATWEDALAAAIAPRIADRDHPEVRAPVLAAAGMAVVRVALKRWIASDDEVDIISLVVTALDLLVDELEPSEGPGRPRTL